MKNGESSISEPTTGAVKYAQKPKFGVQITMLTRKCRNVMKTLGGIGGEHSGKGQHI